MDIDEVGTSASGPDGHRRERRNDEETPWGGRPLIAGQEGGRQASLPKEAEQIYE